MPAPALAALAASLLAAAPPAAPGVAADGTRPDAPDTADAPVPGREAQGDAAPGYPRPLRFDPKVDGLVLGGNAALAIGLTAASSSLTPLRCRWCTPGATGTAGSVDAWARGAVVWSRPADAAHASDLLANVVIPLGALAVAAVPAWVDRDARRFLEDGVATAEGVLVAVNLNLLVKDVSARIRPGPYYHGGGGKDANRSFYSGHASFAASLVAATAAVQGLRDSPATPWIWGVGVPLTLGVGYLRMAADAHWLSDVATGIAVGGAVGYLVPWLLHRPLDERSAVRVVPAPGGLALVF
jgi:membrane-associated phospholipid phosphatase